MEESILITIKKLLGIAEEYTNFDTDIIVHINSAFMVLQQLGVGPEEGFSIEDADTTWTEFVSTSNFELVKSYIYLKVRLMFDPPNSSAMIESVNRQINEFEWRLQVAADPIEVTD